MGRYFRLACAGPKIKKILEILFLFACSGYAQLGSCQDYTCDSLSVRAILDSNGMTDKAVSSVTLVDSGRITFLNLNGYQLKTLPAEIGNLTNLIEFKIMFNQLTSLPVQIGNLKALQVLILFSNQLSSIPKEIGNVTALQNLDLGGNQLDSLPPEIINLKSIFYLNLIANQFTSLPSVIGHLTTLIELNLSSNQLASLPSEIINLTYLRVWVEYNRLCSLSDTIEAWIDENSWEENWRESQKVDDNHYCNGTGTDDNLGMKNVDPFQIRINRGDKIVSFEVLNTSFFIRIFNTSGVQIKQSNIQGKVNLNYSQMPVGVYYARYKTKDMVKVKAFVLE